MTSARICLQWTLIIFNTFSVILGILCAVAATYEYLEAQTDNSFDNVQKLVQLCTASVLVVSAFIGCCGAVNGSIKILGFYVFILVGLIGAHIWNLWFYDEDKHMEDTELLVIYKWIEELVSQGAMNEMQQTYECCGKSNSNDYTALGLPVPKSCYRVKNDLEAKSPYVDGCTEALKQAYLQFYRYEKWAHLGLIGFECFGILLSIVLICKLTTKTRQYRY